MKNGSYIFNVKELGNAHQWNQQRALDFMLKGVSPILIDNTNTQRWEAKFYVERALEHGYQVKIREPETVWWLSRNVEQLAQKNQHGVPAEGIRNMVERWEDDFTVDAILKSEKPSFQKPNRSNGNGVKRENHSNNYDKNSHSMNGNGNISNGSSMNGKSKHQEQSSNEHSSILNGTQADDKRHSDSSILTATVAVDS